MTSGKCAKSPPNAFMHCYGSPVEGGSAREWIHSNRMAMQFPASPCSPAATPGTEVLLEPLTTRSCGGGRGRLRKTSHQKLDGELLRYPREELLRRRTSTHTWSWTTQWRSVRWTDHRHPAAIVTHLDTQGPSAILAEGP